MNEISVARKILKQLTRRVISFYPAFAEICDSAKAGLFLSQAFYWTEETHNDRENGWFYKTHVDWTKETCLTRREQDTCREILTSKGFVSEEIRGFPPKCHFKVEFDAVLKAVSNLAENAKSANLAENAKQFGGKRQPNLAENANVSIIETTTKITDESTAPVGAICATCGMYGRHLCKGQPRKRRESRYRNERVPYVQVEPARSKGEERADRTRKALAFLNDPAKVSELMRGPVPSRDRR